MDGLLADHALVADLDPDRIEENQRIGWVQRPLLPGCDFLQHRVGDRADQIGRSVNPIQLAQMTGNLSRAHAARVHRDDLVIETGEATLIFGDQLWIATARRSEEHTSELQSLLRISYAVF